MRERGWRSRSSRDLTCLTVLVGLFVGGPGYLNGRTAQHTRSKYVLWMQGEAHAEIPVSEIQRGGIHFVVVRPHAERVHNFSGGLV